MFYNVQTKKKLHRRIRLLNKAETGTGLDHKSVSKMLHKPPCKLSPLYMTQSRSVVKYHCLSFKKWILFFFSKFIEGFIYFARDPLRSYLNKFRKKIKFITYIYIIFLAYLGENFILQAALRAGRLYLDSKSGDVITTVAASNQISESASCLDITSLRVIHCVHGGLNYTGFYKFL